MFLALLLQAQTSPLQFLPIILIFGVFYLLLFLPMQRQKKAHQKMLTELKNGDTVVTNGGLIGTVVSIGEDDTLVLRVKPDNIKLQFAKSSVASLASAPAKEPK